MDLNLIKITTEKWEKINQVQILRILKDNNITITENKNGVFVNLSGLGEDIIDKITKYIEHHNKQETEFNKQEEIKDDLKKQIIEPGLVHSSI